MAVFSKLHRAAHQLKELTDITLKSVSISSEENLQKVKPA